MRVCPHGRLLIATTGTQVAELHLKTLYAAVAIGARISAIEPCARLALSCCGSQCRTTCWLHSFCFRMPIWWLKHQTGRPMPDLRLTHSRPASGQVGPSDSRTGGLLRLPRTAGAALHSLLVLVHLPKLSRRRRLGRRASECQHGLLVFALPPIGGAGDSDGRQQDLRLRSEQEQEAQSKVLYQGVARGVHEGGRLGQGNRAH